MSAPRPVRLRVISPIRLSEQITAARRDRLQELAGPGFEVDLVRLPPGAPAGLDSADQVARAGEIIAGIMSDTTRQQADLVMPDCILDPGIDLVVDPQVPVVGLLRLTASTLIGLGRRFSAVVRNEAIAEELTARMDAYGWGDHLVGVDVLHLDVTQVQDEPAWLAATRRIVDQRSADGIDTVYNGCSAIDIGRTASGTWLVDPTRLALDLLATVGNHGGVLSR